MNEKRNKSIQTRNEPAQLACKCKHHEMSLNDICHMLIVDGQNK